MNLNLNGAIAKAKANATLDAPKFRPALSFAQAISNAKESLDLAVKQLPKDQGDRLELSTSLRPGMTRCIPPQLIEQMTIKNKGVTGEAYLKKSSSGLEHVWLKAENGKRYLLSGPEAEALKAALRAAGPFEKVEATVKGELLSNNKVTGVPTILTDSATIDVKPAFTPWRSAFKTLG